MSYGRIWCEKGKIDQGKDTCDNPCTCTVLLGKGHRMTRDVQPQRDIESERERERERVGRDREREREKEGEMRERERERAESSVVSIETLYYQTIQ